MTITLNSDYDVTLNTALLGCVGETNARPVSVEGMEIDGADRYVLTIDYGDGTVYEVDITGGQWTPTADILRSAQTVSCQICAKKLSGNEYILLKKSRIFRLRIGAAIGNNAVPSPDVAMDALDRIDAIGRHTHADMQKAVTAAETATTAADNATKSATAAEKSADTATQAASRAETAQASAETSATQAETAMQGAETARQQAVTAQNAAKISAAQASASAQQTEADKTITSGYAKTAKTCADSTAADKQAVQEMATQVTTDKATVADHAAKVAEDRAAAETAAQTAQSIADSLPDDYVTAVGKIAENTAEISAVKLTDKELTRRVDALFDIGQGVTHKFETDTDTAYAKTVPTGAKLMSVKSVGGKSVVWNQLVKAVPTVATQVGVKFTFSSDGIVTLSGTATTTGNAVSLQSVKNQKGHKYLMFANPLSDFYGVDKLMLSSQSFGRDTTGQGVIITNESSNAVWYYTIYVYEGVTYDNVKLQPQIFDLTQMFGAGNEPSTVEEFEKIFPNDYYPYNAGEIVSAGTKEVVEQGANLCDPTIFAATYPNCISVKDDIIDIISGKTAMFVSGVALKIPQGYRMTVIPVSNENGAINGRIRALFSDGNIRDIYITDGNGLPKSATNYVVEKDISAIAFNWSAIEGGYSFKMQITRNATDSFTPYHITAHKIPEAIKALPGYGVEGNVVDYEAKTYTQNNTIDGTEVKALDTPIVTDISTLIDDDFLRNIEVEAGGSVTFKGGNDDYRIPVPSEEEYIVKLSEVGGTT
jgi:hypothetical protein